MTGPNPPASLLKSVEITYCKMMYGRRYTVRLQTYSEVVAFLLLNCPPLAPQPLLIMRVVQR